MANHSFHRNLLVDALTSGRAGKLIGAATAVAMVGALALTSPVSAAPAQSAAPTPQVVPVATASTSVITVKVGGDRTALTVVAGLAGVTLQLFDGTTAPTTAVTEGFATCVSDAAGDCSFVVPQTQSGGVNRDRRFWIAQTAAPTGWFGLGSLVTGPRGGPFVPTGYTFRTGATLAAGSTYTSGVDFMTGAGSATPTASSGVWQQSRNNMPFTSKCGLKVALILDLSGSVAPHLGDLKNAAKAFTNAMVGTPSQLAVYTYAGTAPANTTNNANRPLTPVSTQAGANTVNGWITGLTAGGSTNWDRGVYQVAQATTNYDIAVMITDGNPSVYGPITSTNGHTRFRETENGIFSANAVKAKGTRIVAFGVGDGLGNSSLNLESVSGTTINSDYYQTDDYAAAGNALRALALGNCQGTVTVVKQVVPYTAPAGSVAGAAPAGGWQFSATTNGPAITPGTGTTAPATGALNFDVAIPGGSGAVPVTIGETAQPGYSLVPQNGHNAVCVRLDTGAAVSVTDTGGTAFRVDSSADYPVSCTVYNRQQPPAATVVVNKNWVVNGVSYPEGDQPQGLQAALTVGGSVQAWGAVRSGNTLGADLTLAETTTIDLPLCSLTSSAVTLANGATVAAALPYQAVLSQPANSFAVTNTVTCNSTLTLVKTVTNDNGGSAQSGDWTLTATGSKTYSGPTGTVHTVDPGTYALAESGPDGYTAASWTCVGGAANGANVIVGLGDQVTCTINNDDQPAHLTLTKVVDPKATGSVKTPADWTLTATPVDIPGQGAVSGNGDPTTSTGVAAASVFAGRYDLSESGPSGFTAGSWSCQGAVVTDHTVTVPSGGTVLCQITNTAQAPFLTLVKNVDNGGTGVTTSAAAWTLTATGPSSISGATGTGSVTEASVEVGTYTLSEAGPAAYTASAWSCVGAASTSDGKVTLTEGERATCTITNTAIPAAWVLSKTADPASGTQVMAGTTITYTLTAHHLEGVAVVGARATDDLTGVLENADLASPLPAGLTRAGNLLTWQIPTLSAGSDVTISFRVLVHADVVGGTIINLASPATPGGSCGICRTEHTTPTINVLPTTSGIPTTTTTTTTTTATTTTTTSASPPTTATTSAPPTAPTPPTPSPTPPLAYTGLPVYAHFGWALLLLVLGSTLLLVGRRRTAGIGRRNAEHR